MADARGAGELEQLLTTDEVAQICRTVPSSVRAWRHHGVGPPGFRVGKRVLYPRSGVVAWLDEQAQREKDR